MCELSLAESRVDLDIDAAKYLRGVGWVRFLRRRHLEQLNVCIQFAERTFRGDCVHCARP